MSKDFNISMICLILNWFVYDPSWMLHLSEFVRTLRSSVLVVFNNFLLIDATDRSKICSDQKRLFFAVSLYSLSSFASTPFKTIIFIFSRETKELNALFLWNFQPQWKVYSYHNFEIFHYLKFLKSHWQAKKYGMLAGLHAMSFNELTSNNDCNLIPTRRRLECREQARCSFLDSNFCVVAILRQKIKLPRVPPLVPELVTLLTFGFEYFLVPRWTRVNSNSNRTNPFYYPKLRATSIGTTHPMPDRFQR